MGGLTTRWMRAAALLVLTVAVAGAAGRFSGVNLSSAVAHSQPSISSSDGR